MLAKRLLQKLSRNWLEWIRRRALSQNHFVNVSPGCLSPTGSQKIKDHPWYFSWWKVSPDQNKIGKYILLNAMTVSKIAPPTPPMDFPCTSAGLKKNIKALLIFHGMIFLFFWQRLAGRMDAVTQRPGLAIVTLHHLTPSKWTHDASGRGFCY